jgi:hypothetical protein
LGPAGSVTLDEAGGLHVVRIEPGPGWRADHLPAAPGTVSIAFHSPAGQTIVVTAESGADGIHVVARPTGDDGDHEAEDDD